MARHTRKRGGKSVATMPVGVTPMVEPVTKSAPSMTPEVAAAALEVVLDSYRKLSEKKPLDEKDRDAFNVVMAAVSKMDDKIDDALIAKLEAKNTLPPKLLAGGKRSLRGGDGEEETKEPKEEPKKEPKEPELETEQEKIARLGREAAKRRVILTRVLGFILAVVFTGFAGREVQVAQEIFDLTSKNAKLNIENSCTIETPVFVGTTYFGLPDREAAQKKLLQDSREALCGIAKKRAQEEISAAGLTLETAWSSGRTKIAGAVVVAFVALGFGTEVAAAFLALASFLVLGTPLNPNQISALSTTINGVLKTKAETDAAAQVSAAAGQGPAAAGTGAIAPPPAPAAAPKRGGKTRGKKSKRRVTRRKTTVIKFAY